ncbi:MAG: hypothetical protein CL610_15705 [Anaerolineaceae bacterium]|nr:hypothetical protein [Anaerolineaceae bacterium]
MMSLRLRLTLWYLILTVLGLSALLLVSYYVLSQSLQQEIDFTLKERANHVIDALSITPNRPIPGISLEATDELSAPGVYLQILNGEGAVVAHSFNLGRQQLPITILTAEGEFPSSDSYATLYIEGQPVRLYNELLIREGVVIGTVQVGQSLIGLYATLHQLSIIYLVAVAAVLLFGLFTGWFVARLGLKPVVSLTRTAQEIARAEDLANRVHVPKTRDEIAILATTFNQMLDRLQSVFEGQQRFLAEIAHELRTPLSSMLGNVDLIVRYGDDPQRRAETIQALQRSGRHVARLIDDLLLLAQSEAGWHLQLRPLAIDDILMEVYEAHFDPRVRIQACDLVSVRGDPDRLRQVFINLIDNAKKYSMPDSPIVLLLRRENGRAWVQVETPGSSIPPEFVSKVFEPFFRAPNHAGQPSTGLGLTIVRWIVQEHGGEISVESSEGRGTVVKFWLPEHVPVASKHSPN